MTNDHHDSNKVQNKGGPETGLHMRENGQSEYNDTQPEPVFDDQVEKLHVQKLGGQR
jgi:hypothetical protein